jgi:hypothetical protein
VAQALVYKGTPEQLANELRRLPNTRKYTVTVTAEDVAVAGNPPAMITFGMFPQLMKLTDDDFATAEWRGEEFEF